MRRSQSAPRTFATAPASSYEGGTAHPSSPRGASLGSARGGSPASETCPELYPAVVVVAARVGRVALSPNGLGRRAAPPGLPPGLLLASMRSRPLNVGLRPATAATALISEVLRKCERVKRWGQARGGWDDGRTRVVAFSDAFRNGSL